MLGHHRVKTKTIWINSNDQTINYYYNTEKYKSYKLKDVKIIDKGNRIDFIYNSYRVVYTGNSNDILRMKIKLRLNGVNI